MRFILYLSIIITASFSGITQTEYPVLVDYVTDEASIISTADKESLQNKLIAYNKANSHQIVILTIEALNGDTIEIMRFKFLTEMVIGQKEADNGILILFSERDREVRIEVGDGFQAIITDAFAFQNY